MAKKSRSKFSHIRHPFLYHSIAPNGKTTVLKAMAKVIHAKRAVTVVLSAAHVRKSIRLKGAGRTDICAGAICLYDHADSFPHFVEGHVDFQYSRAFVVSRLNKYGLPSVCYAYEHNRADLAKLNDTQGGQGKLLRMIVNNGSITIELKPWRVRSKKGRPGAGRGTTGARHNDGKGAKLRWAVMQRGGPPVSVDADAGVSVA